MKKLFLCTSFLFAFQSRCAVSLVQRKIKGDFKFEGIIMKQLKSILLLLSFVLFTNIIEANDLLNKIKSDMSPRYTIYSKPECYQPRQSYQKWTERSEGYAGQYFQDIAGCNNDSKLRVKYYQEATAEELHELLSDEDKQIVKKFIEITSTTFLDGSYDLIYVIKYMDSYLKKLMTIEDFYNCYEECTGNSLKTYALAKAHLPRLLRGYKGSCRNGKGTWMASIDCGHEIIDRNCNSYLRDIKSCVEGHPDIVLTSAEIDLVITDSVLYNLIVTHLNLNLTLWQKIKRYIYSIIF